MKHKNLLLPYSCQRIGWFVALSAAITFIGIILYALSCNQQLLGREDFACWSVAIPTLMLFGSIFLICMSKEKNEDGKTVKIRLYVVTTMVCIVFLIVGICWCFDIAPVLQGEDQGEIFGDVLIGIFLFFITYELVFKLWVNRHEILIPDKAVNYYLLPNEFKIIGICMVALFGILFILYFLAIIGDGNWPGIRITSTRFRHISYIDQILDVIIMIGMLISLCFIALSKEKDEDEMTDTIRVQSFIWSMWVTVILLILGIILLRDISFEIYAQIALYAIFFLYIVKFNIKMLKIRKEGR